MLTSQIPSADDLVAANAAESEQLVRKSQKDNQQLILFVSQISDQMCEFIQTQKGT